MRPPRATKTNTGDSKQQRNVKESKTKADMKMTIGTVPISMLQCTHAKEKRPARVTAGKRILPGRSYTSRVRANGKKVIDPCENSNDSGLGFDQHIDSSCSHDRASWFEEPMYGKRSRLDIKLDNDEVNENFGFPETVKCKENMSLIRTAPVGTTTTFSISANQTTTSRGAVPRCLPLTNRNIPSTPVTLTTQLVNTSKLADISLAILCQPEQQHRARYQTEGSRGAVKDRTGNGFPIVQLTGYNKPATLQVFIGTDCGKVSPHMFYQACRVSGKNSTPCTETKIDGTVVIELQIDPTKDMTVTCDCVGILKERNVDVEHRFPEQMGSRTKKKSTRCRMVFRTTITHDDGVQETLQVCSQPVVCTQPPGIPEICKKSLTSCPATGGLELFVLGKNFLKDTTVHLQQTDDSNNILWEKSVSPDKEYLQQTHLVCVIPPYMRPNITEPVTVKLYVASSGKTSEAQDFIYTPIGGAMASVSVEPSPANQFLNKLMWPSTTSSSQDEDSGMMPPPESNMVPLLQRRSSTSVSQQSIESNSPPPYTLKQEVIDENSQSSMLDQMDLHKNRFRYISEGSLDVHNNDSNMSIMTEKSMDAVRRSSISSDVTLQSNINENSNLSVINDANTMTFKRSFSASLEVHPDCSNLSGIHEESSCSSIHVDTVSNRNLSPTKLYHADILPVQAEVMQNGPPNVGNLHARAPMATVADLVNTNAPSLATLQTFGITETSTGPLPAQSAQSVESYLNKIETKPAVQMEEQLKQKYEDETSNRINSNIVVSNLTHEILNGNSQTVIKQELMTNSMYLVDQVGNAHPESKADINNSTLFKNVAAAQLKEAIENISSTPITTEKLDALVNCAVDRHISNTANSEYQQEQCSKPTEQTHQNIQINTQDVLLNQHNPMLVPPIINTLSPNLMQNTDVSSPHQSSIISPDVILNSQISPSLMCSTNTALAQDSFLNVSTTLGNCCNTNPSIDTPLQTHLSPVSRVSNEACHSSSMHSQLSNIIPTSLPITNSTESDKTLLLTAGTLIEAQNQINAMNNSAKNNHSVQILFKTHQSILAPSSSENNHLHTQELHHLHQTGNSYIQTNPTNSIMFKTEIAQNNILEEQKCEKKTEEIPSVFTTMTENELINIINPNCFDQV